MEAMDAPLPPWISAKMDKLYGEFYMEALDFLHHFYPKEDTMLDRMITLYVDSDADSSATFRNSPYGKHTLVDAQEERQAFNLAVVDAVRKAVDAIDVIIID